jgi:AcrR family transcriptional regulator
MARRTKDEAEQTRNAILDAAERVFNQHGVARTSLEQIARAAGVTRGAVYWHFKDKLALCETMLQRVYLPQEDVLEQLAANEKSNTPLIELKKACCDALQLMHMDQRRRRVATILAHRCEYVEEMTVIMKRRWECKDRMLNRSQIIFERAAKRKQLAAGWKPAVAARALQSLMTGLISNALERERNFNLGKEGTACLEAFFHSISA